jgi:hypothetical protein
MAGELQDYTVDQAAGAIALTLGALGSLLLVIWQSRCLCRCRIGISDQCYLFDCSREPPPLDPETPEQTEAPDDTTETTDERLVPPRDSQERRPDGAQNEP